MSRHHKFVTTLLLLFLILLGVSSTTRAHVGARDVESDLPQLDIDDLDYYRFSEANIEASQVNQWYSNWTIDRQTSPEWSELGEWPLFAKEFFKDYNFDCGLSFSGCRNGRSLYELQNLWPGSENRVLVRRIYFAAYKYSLLHDYALAIEESFKNIHLSLHGMVPEIISSFTQQKEPQRAKLCEILHTVIQTTVNTAISLINSFVSGTVAPYTQAGEALAKLQPTWGKAIGNGEVRKSFNAAGFALGLLGNWQTVTTDRKTRLDIDSGMGHGMICAAFEGDYDDHNGANKDKLSTWLPQFFDDIRRDSRATFDKIYKGVVPVAGEPSVMAIMMANRRWSGENSILDDMRNTGPWEDMMKRNIVTDIISNILAQNHNYMKCTHHPEAQDMCKVAKIEHEWVWKSRFCPRPETDPQLVCQVGKWYFAEHAQHEILMNGVTKFTGFAGGRFNFTLKDMLMESYNHYETYGHDYETMWSNFGMGDKTGGGFHLPTCVNDNLKITDFQSHGTSHPRWQFPAVCGDHHASETGAFMELIKAGKGSDIYRNREPKQFWLDRLPRVLADLPPYDHYMAFCELGISMPRRHDGLSPHWKHRIRMESDKDCATIKSKAAQMSADDANQWFCTSKEGSEVFDRERGHVEMPSLPHDFFSGHKKKCAKYLKAKTAS